MLLYIHIPFCNSKCGYCAFNSLTNMISFKNQYLKALQIDLKNQNLSNIESIYIGGGTPNTLQPNEYEDIFKLLPSVIESTIELNPNASNIDILNEFKALGINRFSIGIQSFRDEKLKLLERIHDTKTAIRFIENAVKCDVKVSIDLIYDTKLDSKDSLKYELGLASSLGIGHISCYALSIDKDSRFYVKHKNPTRESSLCYELKEILDNLGFYQYEVSNYAKTHKSEHNLGYWAYKDYIGVGLGAVGKIGNKRYYKQNDFKNYITNPAFVDIELLNKNDMRLEQIFLGARSEIGIKEELITNKKRLKILLDEKKCHIKNGRIFINNYFLADEIALWLDS